MRLTDQIDVSPFEAIKAIDIAVGVNSTLIHVIDLYHREAPPRGVCWTWALCQGIHEAAWFTSGLWVAAHNPAGIKPGEHNRDTTELHTTDSGNTYRAYSSRYAGVVDHLDLLATYAGQPAENSVDPTRNERIPRIIDAELGRPYAVHSHDLNGIWAVPGDRYGENIDDLWSSLFGRFSR